MKEPKGTIWFVNKDAAPINEYGTHLRTIKQAQYFQEQGYDVKIICSARIYNSAINHLDGKKGLYIEQIHDGIPFLFVRSIAYGNSIAKRAIAYLLFSLNLGRIAKAIGKPDIIVHTSRIPFDAPVYCFAKRCGARYILDITDLWPMEFEHFGFISSKNPILKLFYRIERHLYSKAEHVAISMEGCHKYIIDHKWDKANGGPIDLEKIHYINNGIDLDEFDRNAEEFSIEDSDLTDESIVKVIYLGSIRKANNVGAMIDAAKRLTDHKQIKFLIYGNGPDREALEQRCANEGIENVIFKQTWIEPQYVPYVLQQADVNILNYSEGWAPYGGSMNKMFISFAAGKPIVCNAGMPYSPIRKHDLGIDRTFTDSQEYADAILSMCHLSPAQRDDIHSKCREVVQEFHTHNLNKKFETLCNL